VTTIEAEEGFASETGELELFDKEFIANDAVQIEERRAFDQGDVNFLHEFP
jgi:hypothetical protein